MTQDSVEAVQLSELPGTICAVVGTGLCKRSSMDYLVTITFDSND
jgi:hypothetical protein